MTHSTVFNLNLNIYTYLSHILKWIKAYINILALFKVVIFEEFGKGECIWWFPVHEMQGTDSCFPRRIEIIPSKELQTLPSLRWNFLFRGKCMKLNVLHITILSSLPIVGRTPRSCTKIPSRAGIFDRCHFGYF